MGDADADRVLPGAFAARVWPVGDAAMRSAIGEQVVSPGGDAPRARVCRAFCGWPLSPFGPLQTLRDRRLIPWHAPPPSSLAEFFQGFFAFRLLCGRSFAGEPVFAVRQDASDSMGNSPGLCPGNSPALGQRIHHQHTVLRP